jgi:2,3,4,5-tetrahydropyridine-2-carboxylate N-succinyltransferase
MIGGNCGVYEGALIRKRAVLGSGVILTSSTKVYDIVNNKIITSTEDSPLEIPEGAVVVAGSRAIKSDFAKENGLSLYTPIIVKYRDEKTDAKTALTGLLRN